MPRKQYDYHFIYKTTCIITNKFYIGMHSTSNLEDGYLGSGKRLWYSIQKHGRDNHAIEILEFLPDRSSLKLREKEIVNSDLIKQDLCMNLKEGGDGGFHSSVQSELGTRSNNKKWSIQENRDKQSAKFSLLVKELHEKGIIKSPDWSGRFHKEETKKLIGEKNSISQRGEKNSQFGLKWIHNLTEKVNKKVKEIELQQYFNSGWKSGRKMKF
jgi:hypothetical protein